MTSRAWTSALISGGVTGCAAIVGYVVAGLPGELVGICIGLTFSVLFGVWNGLQS